MKKLETVLVFLFFFAGIPTTSILMYKLASKNEFAAGIIVAVTIFLWLALSFFMTIAIKAAVDALRKK